MYIGKRKTSSVASFGKGSSSTVNAIASERCVAAPVLLCPLQALVTSNNPTGFFSAFLRALRSEVTAMVASVLPPGISYEGADNLGFGTLS